MTRVIAVINEMAAGQIDAIAFTSAPQVRRFRGRRTRFPTPASIAELAQKGFVDVAAIP